MRTVANNPAAFRERRGAAAEAEVPRVHRRMFDVFAWYGRWYLRRHFHAVRLSGAKPHVPPDAPLLVYCNHPSWWDPMVGILLATRFFPQRHPYAPIDAAMLEKYRFFAKLGFFGIQPDSVRGAVTFLRKGQAILASPRRALWVTAEGRFTDPRQRPVSLRPGVARLARRLDRGVVLPLALEYAFWTERLPEALARFGDPIDLAAHRGLSAPAWQILLESQLQQTMDALAVDAMTRDPRAFDTLLAGGAGVSLVYDAWRRLRGERRLEHGEHGASDGPA